MTRAFAGRVGQTGWLRLVLALAVVGCRAASTSRAAPDVARDAGAPQTIVLVSIDGFRADYLERSVAVHLRALAARGVRAERMIPAFPTKTFPNHYTLVTGLHPQHHGITANVMRDSLLGRFATGDDPSGRDARWWLGEPIWVTAERQQVRSAVIFWPGNEAPIGGIRPHWWQRYDGTVSHAARVERVLDWLALPADSAPRLIALYLSDVDTQGHDFGPQAPQTDRAIARADSVIGALMSGIARLGAGERVNLIVVSDHGMTEVVRERVIVLADHVSLDSLTIVDAEPVAAIIPNQGADAYVLRALRGAHPHLAVWRKDEVPARFHFNAGARITPIVALADEGWTIVPTHDANTLIAGRVRGAHGYDNQLPSMGALFVAAGPAFREGLVVPPFGNVHVYPLMTRILGLRGARSDGMLDSVRALLRP